MGGTLRTCCDDYNVSPGFRQGGAGKGTAAALPEIDPAGIGADYDHIMQAGRRNAVDMSRNPHTCREHSFMLARKDIYDLAVIRQHCIDSKLKPSHVG